MSTPHSTISDHVGEQRVREAIRNAASRHIDLLQTITATEEALHGFQNNVAKLEHLEKEQKAQIDAVSEATTITKAKLAEYTKEKDSFARRWAYILSRKRRILEQKIKESEQAYLSALSAQSKAEQRLGKLGQDKQLVENENVTLAVEVEKHGAAHTEIDELYQHVFDGPTPGFPDEDEQEQKHNASKQKYEDTKATLMAVSGAAKDLALIDATVVKAQKEVGQAKYELDTAIFNGSEEALIFLQRCAQLLDQAMKVSGTIFASLPAPLETRYTAAHQPLDRHLVLARSAAIAPFRSAYISSYQLVQTCHDVLNELAAAREKDMVLMKIVRGHESDAKKAVKEASRMLEDSRQALQEIRQNAFEITVGHGASAPAYSECCDRAVQFVNAADEAVLRIPDPIIDDSGLPPPPSYATAVGEAGEADQDVG